MTRRRAPRPLAVAIGGLRDDLAPPGTLAQVQRVWEDVVGPTIAAEARPTAERSGVLTVSCSASVWAAELEMMSDDLVARLNESLSRLREPGGGAAAISELRCRARAGMWRGPSGGTAGV